MSEMLEQAFEKARRLSAAEQDAIAAIILDEMEDEARWEEAFSSSQESLARLASEAMEEDRRGETKDLDPDSL
jgi:hypothetical protein